MRCVRLIFKSYLKYWLLWLCQSSTLERLIQIFHKKQMLHWTTQVSYKQDFSNHHSKLKRVTGTLVSLWGLLSRKKLVWNHHLNCCIINMQSFSTDLAKCNECDNRMPQKKRQNSICTNKHSRRTKIFLSVSLTFPVIYFTILKNVYHTLYVDVCKKILHSAGLYN